MTVDASAGLELDDIQSGALHERPSPYVGTYLLLRIDDRAAGRELVRRLHPARRLGTAVAPIPTHDAWITVAFTYSGPAGARRAAGRRSTASRRSSGRGWRPARPSWATSARAAPEHWEKPLGTPDVHVALAALSPDAARLEAVRREGAPRPRRSCPASS